MKKILKIKKFWSQKPFWFHFFSMRKTFFFARKSFGRKSPFWFHPQKNKKSFFSLKNLKKNGGIKAKYSQATLWAKAKTNS
jgi:hypothetical protein